MIGISEVIQTLGAMVIFSLILLTANRMIQMNTFQEVGSEAEGIAVELAQSFIKEAQTKPFDANTADNDIPKLLPEGFSSCGPGSKGDRNDFDDYDYEESTGNGIDENVDTKLGSGSFHVNVKVFYVKPPDYDTPTTEKTFFKKMVVTVSSDYLKNANQMISLSYLRRYYKTENQ